MEVSRYPLTPDGWRVRWGGQHQGFLLIHQNPFSVSMGPVALVSFGANGGDFVLVLRRTGTCKVFPAVFMALCTICQSHSLTSTATVNKRLRTWHRPNLPLLGFVKRQITRKQEGSKLLTNYINRDEAFQSVSVLSHDTLCKIKT